MLKKVSFSFTIDYYSCLLRAQKELYSDLVHYVSEKYELGEDEETFISALDMNQEFEDILDDDPLCRLFTSPDIAQHLKDCNYANADKKSFLLIACNILKSVVYKTQEMDERFFSYVDRYFDNDYFDDEYSNLESAESITIKDRVIRRIKQTSCFPMDPHTHRIINYNDIKPVNLNEEEKFNTLSGREVILARDLFFSTCYFEYPSFENGQVLSEDEKAIRKMLKGLLTDFYYPQIHDLASDFKKDSLAIMDIVDNKWNLLMSKKERGIYRDEWGVVHTERWEKEFDYFIDNVIFPSIPLNKISKCICFAPENMRNVIASIKKLNK
jgi:hypothetical protein